MPNAATGWVEESDSDPFACDAETSFTQPDDVRLRIWKIDQLVEQVADNLKVDDEDLVYLRRSIEQLFAEIAIGDYLGEMTMEHLVLGHFSIRRCYELAAQPGATDRVRNLHLKYAVLVTTQMQRLLSFLEQRKAERMSHGTPV